jgi:YHS domain-containing protein
VTRVILFAALLLTLAWAFWRLVDGVIETFGGTTDRSKRKRRGAPAVKLTRDPVCGTWVTPTDARFIQSGSTTYFFCSDECRRKFQSR